MFCPNCGTQNPDQATTCSKCGFNLKGAAAPKFKGTMLMMNAPPVGKNPAGAQPGAAPPGAPPGAAPPPTPGAAPGAPSPAGAAAQERGRMLKGTMLGVAPPAPGAPLPGAIPPAGGPQPPPPPQAPQGGAPGGGYGGGGYGGPVNPLGGTMVAEPGAMGMGPGFGRGPGGPGGPGGGAQPPPGAPNSPYGPPPGGAGGASPYGPPPGGGGAPGFGAPPPPPPNFGSPGGGQDPYGAPGGGYGAPGGGGYGAQAPYGAPPPIDGAPHFGMQPMTGGVAGSAPMVHQGYGGTPGAHGPVGNLRNPITITLLGFFCFPYLLFVMWSTLNELAAYRQKDDINPIMFFVPILGIILMWGLPEKVLEAKHMAGIPNPQVVHPVLYLLLWPYFFTTDLNEIFQASGAQLPPG